MTFTLNRIVSQVKRKATQHHVLPHNENSREEWDIDGGTAQHAVTFSVVELSKLSTSETCIQQHDAGSWNLEMVTN